MFIQQGFQLVVSKDDNLENKKKINSIVMRSTVHDERFMEMRLSIGRIVHTVTLFGSEIQVTRYRPR